MNFELFDKRTKQDDFRHYRPIPFWSWNNKLDADELVRQIRGMKEVGLGGFIMHARTGLLTEYLSEEWFQCVRVCLDEAKALGMDAWMYDENGWPSGFVGGELLKNPNNLAQYLTCEDRDDFDPKADFCYLREGDSFRRMTADCGTGRYRCVYLHASPSNTDILNPAVVTQFIEKTYEPYFERFGDRFGKEFVGFFTDEPQYYRYATPYTRVAAPAYREKYGEELADGLCWLFSTEPEGWGFRTRYYKLLNELYTVNYYKRLFDWCEGHGCAFTGHSVEESALFTQMWGGAGVMPSYEYETVPGIDCLARAQPPTLMAKQVGSAASQLGKSRVLTETFGCSGWDAVPRELKFIAECQLVSGVNYLCLHLMSYSIQGQGKLDHPPCFSKVMTWWGPEFKEFNDYFGHLGALLASTQEEVNTLVLHPMHSVYLRYLRADESGVKELDAQLTALLDKLDEEHVNYHLADESQLARHGAVENVRLRVGKCLYDYVIVPHLDSVDGSTKRLLEEYSARGGRVLVYDRLPELVDGLPGTLDVAANLDWTELAEGQHLPVRIRGKLRCALRRGKGFRALYLLNNAREEAEIDLSGTDFSGWDPVSAELKLVPDVVSLRPGESLVLVEGKGRPERGAAQQEPAAVDVTEAFRLTAIDANNLTLDRISISRDGAPFEPARYVYAVKDALIRADYHGDLRARYTFTMAEVLPLTLRFEQQKWISVTCNGQELTAHPTDFDVNFREADLTPYLVAGENELLFEIYYYQSPIVRYALYDPEATESLRNCLVFDTEVEAVYLRGDFAVGADRVIRPAAGTPTISHLEQQGYPFFGGEAVFSGEVDFAGERAELQLEGRFMTAEVAVDGQVVGSMVLSDRLQFTTSVGKHLVTVRLKSSLRNVFGPHHFADPEPLGVGPFNFTYLGSYDENGVSEWYRDEYHVVPFGADAVKIRFF